MQQLLDLQAGEGMDLTLPLVCGFVMTNPIFWNAVSRVEYRTRLISRLAGGQKNGVVILATLILVLNGLRTNIFHSLVETDDTPLQLLSNPVVVLIGQAMVAIGTIFVLWSTWRLGFFGTFMGDHFGLLLKERVTGFPFNVTENPMYWGSAMIYFGYSMQHASLVGFLLSLCITLSYAIAIRIEEPFTTMIYENAASHSD